MKLRQLFEQTNKTAVAAFGRMNPPTIGHKKLVDKIKSFDGDHYVFLSQTQKPKDNPLPFDVKLEFAKKFFPGVNVGHSDVRTPIQMLQMLEKLGYTDIVYVAGSDRVAQFEKLFNDYNGKEYNFDSIEVVSAGERDPDAEGAEGMSASKMRAAAAAGDFESFAQGVPDPRLAEKMYDAVRTGMGVKDSVAAEDASPEEEDEFHVELDKLVHKYFGHSSDEKKEKKKYSESDVVLDKTSLRTYIRDMIIDYIEKENDIEKLSKVLKLIVGKTVKHRGSRYQVTSEDIVEACKYGKYYCSTDNKTKCRQGPKKSRG